MLVQGKYSKWILGAILLFAVVSVLVITTAIRNWQTANVQSVPFVYEEVDLISYMPFGHYRVDYNSATPGKLIYYESRAAKLETVSTLAFPDDPPPIASFRWCDSLVSPVCVFRPSYISQIRAKPHRDRRLGIRAIF